MDRYTGYLYGARDPVKNTGTERTGLTFEAYGWKAGVTVRLSYDIKTNMERIVITLDQGTDGSASRVLWSGTSEDVNRFVQSSTP